MFYSLSVRFLIPSNAASFSLYTVSFFLSSRTWQLLLYSCSNDINDEFFIYGNTIAFFTLLDNFLDSSSWSCIEGEILEALGSITLYGGASSKDVRQYLSSYCQ